MKSLIYPAVLLPALAAALSSCHRDEDQGPTLADFQRAVEESRAKPPAPASDAPTNTLRDSPDTGADLVLTADAPPKRASGATATGKDSAGAKAGSGSPKTAGALSEAAMKEAKSMYGMRCASCHGMDGAGQGPIAAALKPPPRDFRDAEWQSSVTDQHIEKIIEGGGTAVGKSPAMPANPDLTGKPVVQGLRAYIRSMRQ